MKLFIGLASSDDIPKKYYDDCSNYLNELLKDNDLVFGAYSKGLMGLSYNIAKENNRKVSAVALKRHKEDTNDLDLDNLSLVSSILKRTNELIQSCDAIIFLPGGIGTINEIFASIDMARSNEINKKIVFYNSNGYYDKLFEFLDRLYTDKFSPDEIKKLYYVSNSAKDTLEYLNK